MIQLSEIHWARMVIEVIGVSSFLLIMSQLSTSSEVYSESCQISNVMGHFGKIVNGFSRYLIWKTVPS